MFGNITTINSNFSAMEALYNLKKTNGRMSFHQTRLSTGKRINSAEDDAAGYHIAKHLESRRRGLSQALDNVSTAKNILNIAEGGYQAQMSIMQEIKENLTQAADGALSDAQRGAIGDRIESLLNEIDEIKDQTKYNGYTLFTEGTMVFQVGEESEDQFTVTFDASASNAVGESGTNVNDIPTLSTDTTDDWENITASDNFTNEILVSWLETEETEYYNLYRDGFLLSVLAQDMPEYTDIYVESDTVYEYCIESVNNCGGSNWNCDYGSLSIGEIGDINLDQVIDILDIVIILNFVLELEIPTEDQLWLADGNSDGVINILDVVLLVNMILSN